MRLIKAERWQEELITALQEYTAVGDPAYFYKVTEDLEVGDDYDDVAGGGAAAFLIMGYPLSEEGKKFIAEKLTENPTMSETALDLMMEDVDDPNVFQEQLLVHPNRKIGRK